MSTLIVAEHDSAGLKPATLNAVTAAGQLPGETHVLLTGSDCEAAAGAAVRRSRAIRSRQRIVSPLR